MRTINMETGEPKWFHSIRQLLTDPVEIAPGIFTPDPEIPVLELTRTGAFNWFVRHDMELPIELVKPGDERGCN